MCPLRILKTTKYLFSNSSHLLFRKTVCGHQQKITINILSQRCTHTINRFGRYSIISKIEESPKANGIPGHIDTPSYYRTGEPSNVPTNPEINSSTEIQGVLQSCNLVKNVFKKLSKYIKVGTTTDSLDVIAHQFIIENGAYPSPLNYHGFPRSICTSVNNVALHGIPDNRPLSDGDIISIDITVFYKGFHGDSCHTFVVGDVDTPGLRLMAAAELCRNEAISICKPGVPFSDIGKTVEEVAAANDVTVVPAVTGHGIGCYFHGPPDIYHIYNDYPGVMEAGMIFTIEPVVCQGSGEIEILEDGWTAVMVDNGRAAQFEHTVLITSDSHKILT